MTTHPLSAPQFQTFSDNVYYYAGRICTYVALCIFSEARVQLACFQPILAHQSITHFALGALTTFSQHARLQHFEGREDLNDLIPRVIAATFFLWSEETVRHYTPPPPEPPPRSAPPPQSEPPPRSAPPPPVRVASEEELAAMAAARAERVEREVVQLIGKIERQLLNNKNVNEGDIDWYCLLQRPIRPKIYERLASRLIQEAHWF